MQAVGQVGNGLAKAGGATPAYQLPGSDEGDGTFGKAAGQGLMGLLQSFRAKKYQTGAGAQGPGLAQGGGIGAQPGAQAGTLFGSMGPARSSQPSY